MATKRMLIEATHPEETRVVVVTGNRLDDFDVEVESRKQLKGNIYLAKVIRVEPSLQAAFVDFGGNRHGFLPFNEIHPDYYQIPVADREELLAEQEAAGKADEAAEAGEQADNEAGAEVETVGGDDIEEVEARRPTLSYRHYKIQEVIKRRQILLVQVVKEERGTKGAALTTYISLAGRYCVLMPNTARGGGISRKISNGADRKRLKAIFSDLGIPKGMAVIVRTAGAKRSKAEIKRDYEYLLRLWDEIRRVTLESTAPALVHEEGNLIKRSIRDLYNNDIEEIVVDGDTGYRMAKDFMKLLIPSHAKRVKRYADSGMPMMHRYQVESQLDAMHSHDVQLKSGGYIVINATEALVAIDVNSGRSTRERNIEETALKTNLEAADEVARQLRLRDLAGLIVIDFIDMESPRNQAQVERRLKEAMHSDRARIQLGRISPFGLLELSRQRLRPSLMETSSGPCPYCGGTGRRRSTDSAALAVLRAIEEEAHRRRATALAVFVPSEVALYILNHKRAAIADIEARYDMSVLLSADDSLIPPDHRIERTGTRKDAPEGAAADAEARAEDERTGEGDDGKRRRRRRPRKRRRPGEERETAGETAEAAAPAAETSGEAAEEATPAEAAGEEGAETSSKRRRRGRRGGRRRGRKTGDQVSEEQAPAAEAAEPEAPEAPAEALAAAPAAGEGAEAEAGKETKEEKAAAPAKRKAKKKAAAGKAAKADAEPAKKKPARKRRAKKTEAEPAPAALEAEAAAPVPRAETGPAAPQVEPAPAAPQAEPAPPAPEPALPVAKPEPAPPALKAEPQPPAPVYEMPGPVAPPPASAGIGATAASERAPIRVKSEEPAAEESSSKTEVIDLNAGDQQPAGHPPRSGWWRRLSK